MPGPGAARRRATGARRAPRSLGRGDGPPRHAAADARPVARHEVRHLRPVLCRAAGHGDEDGAAARLAGPEVLLPPRPARGPARGARLYEKARLVAGCANDRTVAKWIERAEAMTCIQLRRAIEAEEQEHMSARRELDVRAAAPGANLMSAAFRAAREAAGTGSTPANASNASPGTSSRPGRRPSRRREPRRRGPSRATRGDARPPAAAAPPCMHTTCSSGRPVEETSCAISPPSVRLTISSPSTVGTCAFAGRRRTGCGGWSR